MISMTIRSNLPFGMFSRWSGPTWEVKEPGCEIAVREGQGTQISECKVAGT